MSEQQLYKKINGEFVPFGPTDYEAFIDYHWSPGLWLVTNRPNCRSRELLHEICKIPDKPELFTSIMMLRDELAEQLRKLNEPVIYSDSASYTRSYSDRARKLLEWMAEKQGVKQIPFLDPIDRPDRKIEPNL